MKYLLIAGMMFTAAGCATLMDSVTTPTYTIVDRYNYRKPSQADTTEEFIDISGNPEAKEKLKNLQYDHVGWITWDEAAYNEKNMVKIKNTAKKINADGILIWKTNHNGTLQNPYGIDVKVIQFTK